MKKLTSLVLIFASAGLATVLSQNCSPGFALDDSFDFASSIGSSTSTKVRRLSNAEYKASITDALTEQFSRRGTPNLGFYNYSSAVQGALASVPSDITEGKLGTDQTAASLTATRFSAYVDVSLAVAMSIASDAARLRAFAGACASDVANVSDTVCIDTFLTEFATLAFRTPPTSGELADLKKNAPNWVSLIGRVLIHPRFITHFERDGVKAANGTFSLTDYELEARLTSVFWKSIPDVAGLAVAKSGTLKTPAGLNAEIARLLNSQKAKDNLWNFYQQYFAIKRLPLNAYSTGQVYDKYAEPYTAAQLDQAFKAAVIEDGRQFLDYLTWTQQGKLEDLFRSPLIFTTNPLVASIYGVSPRANANAAPIMDPTNRYRGILTRPMITQQSPSVNGETNHILRGVFVMTNIMGTELGQPANFADQQAAGITIPAGASTRTTVTLKTGISSCISCHQQINPTGFAFGHFDTLGRYITTENRYQLSGNTVITVASNAVDSTTSLVQNGRSFAITDVASLVDTLVQTGKLYNGFANYYFKYAFGRAPSSNADRALINGLLLGLKTKSIRGAFETMASQPEFAVAQPPQGN